MRWQIAASNPRGGPASGRDTAPSSKQRQNPVIYYVPSQSRKVWDPARPFYSLRQTNPSPSTGWPMWGRGLLMARHQPALLVDTACCMVPSLAPPAQPLVPEGGAKPRSQACAVFGCTNSKKLRGNEARLRLFSVARKAAWAGMSTRASAISNVT